MISRKRLIDQLVFEVVDHYASGIANVRAVDSIVDQENQIAGGAGEKRDRVRQRHDLVFELEEESLEALGELGLEGGLVVEDALEKFGDAGLEEGGDLVAVGPVSVQDPEESALEVRNLELFDQKVVLVGLFYEVFLAAEDHSRDVVRGPLDGAC